MITVSVSPCDEGYRIEQYLLGERVSRIRTSGAVTCKEVKGRPRPYVVETGTDEVTADRVMGIKAGQTLEGRK